jgi:hypothetical protein
MIGTGSAEQTRAGVRYQQSKNGRGRAVALRRRELRSHRFSEPKSF